MNYFNGTLAYSSTGVKAAVVVGFQPVAVTVRVGQKAGVTQLFGHLSVGSGNPTLQRVDSCFQDTTGGKTTSTNAKIVSVLERSGASVVEVLAMKIDSFTATGVAFEVLTANLGYDVYIEVYG